MDPIRTLWENDAGTPVTIDQTLLPFEVKNIRLTNSDECATAIKTMQVRGAPLIGAVGAWGMALALREDPSTSAMRRAHDQLLATRPTGVNLRWALEQSVRIATPLPEAERADAATELARRICEDDVQCNLSIGKHALSVLQPLRRADETLQLLTHCNAGRVACIAYGTALAPMYLMQEQELPLHVWVGETRPRNQGASLTAWELDVAGIDHTVIADNAGGLLMMNGKVDAVIVGCDCVASNGDVVNKIGTYLKALAAAAHSIPFYVACPTSTIDMRAQDGMAVPIENRASTEVTEMRGETANGTIETVRITPAGSSALNPAFDVTPAALVTALITEHGLCEPSHEAIAALGLSQ